MAKKILVIDDEPDICEVVAEYLNTLGYEARYALNGAEGLKLIEKECPRLIFLDIGLPDMDGIEVLKEINRRFSHITVIIMSAHKEDELVKQAVEHGVCDYIVKPIQLEVLAEKFVKGIIGLPED